MILFSLLQIPGRELAEVADNFEHPAMKALVWVVGVALISVVGALVYIYKQSRTDLTDARKEVREMQNYIAENDKANMAMINDITNATREHNNILQRAFDHSIPKEFSDLNEKNEHRFKALRDHLKSNP